jgi:hypothetical protein
MNWYPWVVAAHVVGAFGFVLAHGVSAFVAFRVRRARDAAEVGTLMSLSHDSMLVAYAALLLLIVSGVAAGFMGSWWGHAWIWVSIGLLFAIAIGMFAVGTTYYMRLRQAIGGAGTPGGPGAQGPIPVGADELARLLDSPRPYLLAAIGGGGLAGLIGLMMLKPW